MIVFFNVLYLVFNIFQKGRDFIKLYNPYVKILPSPFYEFTQKTLCVEWRYSIPRFEHRNRNINLNKYFISLSGDRTHKPAASTAKRLCPCATTGLLIGNNIFLKKIFIILNNLLSMNI